MYEACIHAIMDSLSKKTGMNWYFHNACTRRLLLDAAAKANPGAYWWIKGDGCNLVKGLCESVAGVWSGDVDLNNASLQHSIDEYKSKLSFIS